MIFSLSLSNQSINKLCKSLICKLDVFTLFGLIYDSINFLYAKICSLNFHQRHYEYAMFPNMCLKILKVYQPCFLIERDKKQLSIAESYIKHLPEIKGWIIHKEPCHVRNQLEELGKVQVTCGIT